MKKATFIPGLVGAGIAFLIAGAVWGVANPWMQPYRASKLEWLALEMQAQNGTECVLVSKADFCIAMHYGMRPPDTILILAETRGPVPIDLWDEEAKTAQKLVTIAASGFQLPPPKIEILRKSENVNQWR